MTQIKYFIYGTLCSILLMLLTEAAHSGEPVEVIAYASDAVPKEITFHSAESKVNEASYQWGIRELDVKNNITLADKPAAVTNAQSQVKQGRRPVSREELSRAGQRMINKLFMLRIMYLNTRKQ